MNTYSYTYVSFTFSQSSAWGFQEEDFILLMAVGKHRQTEQMRHQVDKTQTSLHLFICKHSVILFSLCYLFFELKVHWRKKPYEVLLWFCTEPEMVHVADLQPFSFVFIIIIIIIINIVLAGILGMFSTSMEKNVDANNDAGLKKKKTLCVQLQEQAKLQVTVDVLNVSESARGCQNY